MKATPARITSPFVYGRALGSQDAACPRPTLERAVQEAIINRSRLALVGDRQSGKSTLVVRTHQMLGAPLLYWDLHLANSTDDLIVSATEGLGCFLRELYPIASKVTPWIRDVLTGIQDIKLIYKETGSTLSARMPKGQGDLKRLLGYVAEIAKRKSFSFFIDELQDLTERLEKREAEAVTGLLRSELQRIPIACFFAGGSREPFLSMFFGYSSPFYESARLVEVQPIPRDDFARHLQSTFATGEFRPSWEFIDALLIAGGHSPTNVQRLACEIWNTAESDRLTSRELHVVLAKLLGEITL